VARDAARPDPAGDRPQLAGADEGANLFLGAPELGGELAHGQGSGPFHVRSIARRGGAAAIVIAMTPEDSRPSVREEFRPLTGREREILEMLLSVPAPGVEELRAQVPHAEAARWSCGCASFALKVDRERAPRSSATARPFAEAATHEREDASRTFDLLLWVEDGWLSGVEIVDYVDRHGDDSPEEIPPANDWEAPRPRVRAS
jgi:hypothetical protein